MNLNNSQNFVQPSGNAGGGVLGAILGAYSGAKAFERQVQFAGLVNNMAKERDLFKIVAKNHVDTEGIKHKQGAQMDAYVNAHTAGIDKEAEPDKYNQAVEAGRSLYKKHLREAGMNGGLLGQRMQESIRNEREDEVAARSDVGNKTAKTSRTENQFDGVNPAESGAKIHTPGYGINPSSKDIGAAVLAHNKKIEYPFNSTVGSSGRWSPTSFENDETPTFSEENAQDLLNASKQNTEDNRTSNLSAGMDEGK